MVPAVAVGHDGLRIARGDRLQPLRDVAQRLVPAHPLEPPGALGAAAPHRMQQALGVVGALGIARDLGAQHAVGVPVLRVALHLHRDAVLARW